MKQKLKMILAILLALVIMTGCSMKEIISVKITEDKKASIDMLIAYGNETIDQFIAMSSEEGAQSEEVPTYTDEERWAYLESSLKTNDIEGFKYEKYEKDDFKGYRLTTEEVNLDELINEESTESVNLTADGVKAVKKLFTKT